MGGLKSQGPLCVLYFLHFLKSLNIRLSKCKQDKIVAHGIMIENMQGKRKTERKYPQR